MAVRLYETSGIRSNRRGLAQRLGERRFALRTRVRGLYLFREAHRVARVAVVVSEETGRLSLVVGGQIERGLDGDTLRARLRALVLHGGRVKTGRSSRQQYA